MTDFHASQGAEKRRMLARALSRIADASVYDILAMSQPEPARAAWRVGVAGPPGSGKSSLIGRLAIARLRHYPPTSTIGSERLAVVAIDPSSPRHHGAVLGDRIRMDTLVDDARAYVRSIASRGGPEGLAHNITDIIALVDAYGFDELLLETVGVGQAECAVRTLVDTLILVLHPEAGDSIQAMKSGLLELPDIYVVNKADLPGAVKTASELRAVLRAVPNNSAWDTPVIEVSQDDASSVDLVNEAIQAHRVFLKTSRDATEVKRSRNRYRLQSLLQRGVHEILDRHPDLVTQSNPALGYREALRILLEEISLQEDTP